MAEGQQAGPKKPETGQCNLDRAAINLNACRDVVKDELVHLLSVCPQPSLSNHRYYYNQHF
jgi:hypothetical protein